MNDFVIYLNAHRLQMRMKSHRCFNRIYLQKFSVHFFQCQPCQKVTNELIPFLQAIQFYLFREKMKHL